MIIHTVYIHSVGPMPWGAGCPLTFTNIFLLPLTCVSVCVYVVQHWEDQEKIPHSLIFW